MQFNETSVSVVFGLEVQLCDVRPGLPNISL